MKKLFVVVNEEDYALSLDSSPFGDGECLVVAFSMFSVFSTKTEANRALNISKRYAQSQKLDTFWETSKWKVIPLSTYLAME